MANRTTTAAVAIATTMVAISLSTVAVAQTATSPEPPRSSERVDAFDVRWELDVPIAAGLGLIGGSLHLLQDELVTVRCGAECDPERVNDFDATTRGFYSADAATAGNVLVTTSLLLGPTVSLLTALGAEHEDRWVHFAEDVVLLGEVVGVSVFVHQLTAFASQRPRPYVYSGSIDEALRNDANSYLSFYSGHTANAFAVATASSYLFMRRNPRSPFIVPLWTLSHGLAALQGYSRVTSGYHYWSDVLVGATIGTALGLAIPILHETDQPGVAIVPLPLRGGAGLAIATSSLGEG